MCAVKLSMEKSFTSMLLRLKEQTGLEADKQVAELLGMAANAFNARKARDSFPEDKLFALAARRPDLGIDPVYVLTGQRSMPDPVRKMFDMAAATTLSANVSDEVREGLAAKLADAMRAQAVEGLLGRLMDAWGRCDTESKELVCRVAEGLAGSAESGKNR